MAQHAFDAFDGDEAEESDADALAGEDECGYALPSGAAGEQEEYRVDIALTAVRKWAEVDQRDLSSAETLVESLLTVLLQIFPSFSVLYVRVRPIMAGEGGG